ncbi:hypothetical protein GGF46_003149 [Coemansia sp. RSA 552]|nr:hypothetical protein GGF46_003149 [Coemansia sp. RSA 552]
MSGDPLRTPTRPRSQRRGTPRSTARQIVPRQEECWPVTTLLEKYPELRYERWLPSVLRSIEKSSGAVFDERLLRGPRGNLLCLWCGREGKSSEALFCTSAREKARPKTRYGEGCEHEHRMRRDNQYVRKQLLLRDGGVCSECGIDAHALFIRATDCRTLDQRGAMFRRLAKQTPDWHKKVRRPLTNIEYEFTEGMFWEAAHVIDVKHGGGLCGLDGFHTLCVPCHTEEYMRSYAQDLSNLPLYQSPPDAGPPPPRTPLSPVVKQNGSAKRRGNVLSSKKTNIASPLQRTSNTGKDSSSPLILLDSSSSASSTPSPGDNPAPHGRQPLALETPTKQRSRNSTSSTSSKQTPVSLCRRRPVTPSFSSPLMSPVPRLAAIIDLTASPSRSSSRRAHLDLDSLAGRLTVFNISSDEDASADEIEVLDM